MTDTDDRDTADRRRVIEVALDRRPGMTVADLHDALAALGLDVPTPVLEADLDALGFEVEPRVAADDEPAGGGGTVAEDGPEAPVPVADEPVADEPVAVHEPAADEVVEDGPVPWWQGRAGVAALVAAVLVVALLVVVVRTGGDEDDVVADGSDRGDGPGLSFDWDAIRASTSSSTTAPGPAGPVPTAPVGPGEDQELFDGVDGVAGFDEDGDGLGPAPDGGEWSIGAGQWSRSDGAARLDDVDGGGGVGVATFDPQAESYRLQVRLASLVAGNGLVFGSFGAREYYVFTAAPQLGTFVLAKVVDGEREVLGDTSLTATEGGRAVIGVHVTPGHVEALVNGAVVLSVDLPAPLPGPGIGIGSAPGASGGTFDEVSYRVDP